MCGVATFFGATAVLGMVDWHLPMALSLLLAGLAALTRALPKGGGTALSRVAPRWDLPARMVIASTFVVVITSATRHLGPQLSGLVAPFPVFVLILAVFTQLHQGPGAAGAMMRGVILGSLSFAAFFVVVSVGLAGQAIAPTYLAATVASIACSGLVYLLLHRPTRPWPWAPPIR